MKLVVHDSLIRKTAHWKRLNEDWSSRTDQSKKIVSQTGLGGDHDNFYINGMDRMWTKLTRENGPAVDPRVNSRIPNLLVNFGFELDDVTGKYRKIQFCVL